MGNPQEGARIKYLTIWILVLMAGMFAVFSFFPEARQRHVFRYGDLCDYRTFILPTIESPSPYEPDKICARDACYPPIAYCAVRALSADRGIRWSLTRGEMRLLVSIFLMQLLGAVLLVMNGRQGAVTRIAEVVAITMSPACICSVLRGNPSGWAFAMVCVFLVWHDSENKAKRVVASIALGAATALKIAPCLFGLLYLREGLRAPRRIPYLEIVVSAVSATTLLFVPFGVFGGWESIPLWISNAAANSTHYSVADPLWGIAAIANKVIDCVEPTLPYISWYALATNILAGALVVVALFTKGRYHALLFIGAAMAFVTHHDYGGAYLIPAFVAWIEDLDASAKCRSGIYVLLEAVAWCVVMTPLQIPNPCNSGTMNAMLQNEFLFVLLVSAVFGAKAPSLLADKSKRGVT